MTSELLQQTKKRIYDDGRTVVSWARLRGFHPATATHVLNGHYNLKSETAQKIFEQLRRDGYLVDEDKAA